MKNIIRLLGIVALISVIALAASSCSEVFGIHVITGSGKLETRSYEITDFTRIETGSFFEVTVNKADTYSISVTADDNLFDYIEVRKTGDTLNIRMKGIIKYLNTNQQAVITMPEFRGIELSGASKGIVSGFNSSERVSFGASGASSLGLDNMSTGDADFEVSGASRVNGTISMNDAYMDVSGASRIELSGKAAGLDIEGSGASRFDITDLTAGDANIELSGASDARVNLSGRLDMELSGASTLYYSGTPTIGDMEISGGSSVHNK